jgi:1-acyl-sn-glycerol-3-phosphate acyltransferase
MSHKGVPSFRRWLSFSILLASLAIYALMAPFGYAILALAAVFPVRDWRQRTRFLQTIIRRAFRGFHVYLRWIRFLDFRPTNPCPEGIGACVLVANHPTMTDAMALLASVPGTCTAVRADIYDKYWIQPLLRGAGHFSAGFGNPLSGASVVQSSVERLAQGFRVLLFPEGTRSPLDGGLHQFGRTAFEVACRADVPIVAVLIDENPRWLGKGSRLAASKEVVSVKSVQLLKVAHPRDFFGDSRLLRDYVETAYREALALPTASPGRDLEKCAGAHAAPLMKVIGEYQ